MAHSLEVRVPFLDKKFLDVALMVDPDWKLHQDSNGQPRIEKWAFRAAFQGTGYLPSEVLWRKKEQFGDGVGYDWIGELKMLCEEAVSDTQFSQAHTLYPSDTPVTKEQFYYRRIFENLFPGESARRGVKRWYVFHSSL